MKFLVACLLLVSIALSTGERVKRGVIAAAPFYPATYASPYASPYAYPAAVYPSAQYVAPNQVIARASRVVGAPGFAAKYYSSPYVVSPYAASPYAVLV